MPFYGAVLQQIIEPWDEHKVTWNTQPKSIEMNQVFVYPFIKNSNFIDVDVTSSVCKSQRLGTSLLRADVQAVARRYVPGIQVCFQRLRCAFNEAEADNLLYAVTACRFGMSFKLCESLSISSVHLCASSLKSYRKSHRDSRRSITESHSVIMKLYPDLIFFRIFYIFAPSKLSRGVIGNTSDSGSEEFRFET